jgi:hypothetical protein
VQSIILGEARKKRGTTAGKKATAKRKASTTRQIMEDQLTTWIAAGVSFVTGWVLDNGIPRKIAKFLVSLIVKKKD